jgi:hypothetical protein
LAQPTATPSSRHQKVLLMADDNLLLYRSGLKQVLQMPARHENNPVIPNDNPWELAIGYCSVHRDPTTGEYACWYQSYAGNRAQDPTRRVTLCYATSKDGLTWTKPKLRLFDFNGDLDTNIVLVGNGGRSVNYGASVLFDPTDTKSGKRYKLAYWDFTENEGLQRPGLCVAFSPDGIRWKKYSKAPLLQGSYGEPTQPPFSNESDHLPADRPAISDVMDLMWDPIHKQYCIYSKTWIDGPDGRRFWKRAVARTTSKDFINWSQPQLILSPSSREDHQFHGASIFYEGGLFLGLLQKLDLGGFDRGGSGNMPAELIWSHDGLDWQRPFSQTSFMQINQDKTAFDAGCLWTSANPIRHGSSMRLYYGAYPGWHADLTASPTGIGLMTIPLNRWIGLTPENRIGQATLKPIYLEKETEITINADASDGEIRLELLDASGYRVMGFTSDTAKPLHGNGLVQEVRWKNHSLRTISPGDYHIRIHLKEATLYGLTLDRKQL